MKAYSLKIAIVSVLVVVMVGVFWANVFGFSQSHSVQETKSTAATEDKGLNRAEKLYQMAVRVNNTNIPPDRKFRIMTEYCQQIVERYPDSPQAEIAGQLLQEVPEIYQKGYVLKARPSPDIPDMANVKKTRILRTKLADPQDNDQSLSLEHLDSLTQEEIREKLQNKPLELPHFDVSVDKRIVP